MPPLPAWNFIRLQAKKKFQEINQSALESKRKTVKKPFADLSVTHLGPRRKHGVQIRVALAKPLPPMLPHHVSGIGLSSPLPTRLHSPPACFPQSAEAAQSAGNGCFEILRLPYLPPSAFLEYFEKALRRAERTERAGRDRNGGEVSKKGSRFE
ncbi:hypothetical protein HPP92_023450 [Vanilla planifolia]|uniref:Uncharacterized protein n=1 Tax=Vanilla planifolia TaxID=51239 RepID=A0A835PST9_VANPL|nr:hypothetical protein HPP92_023450 [Vanilla planifolia]